MSNEQLIQKIKEWCNKNAYQAKSLLSEGRPFIYRSDLFSILDLLKDIK